MGYFKELKCTLCGSPFIGGNRAKYCHACLERRCEVCGKSFCIDSGNVHKKNVGRFCSLKCRAYIMLCSPEIQSRIKHPSSHDHPMYKGGHITKDRGYKIISVKNVLMYEHRYVMEQHLGRKLLKTESVHHINKDKLDNRIDNLELFKTKSEHTLKYHLKGRDF